MRVPCGMRVFYCTGRKETLYEKKPLTSHATCNIRRSPAWFSIRPPAVSGASKKFVSKFVSNSRNRLFRAKGKPRKTLIFRGFLESMRLDLNQRPLRPERCLISANCCYICVLDNILCHL